LTAKTPPEITNLQQNNKHKQCNNQSHGTDITINNISSTQQHLHTMGIKQDIMNLVCQDLAKFMHCKLEPLKQELKILLKITPTK